MNTLRNLIVFTIFLGLSALAFSGDSKPNFSGTWEMNVAKSEMGGAPITKLSVQIEHKDPVFKYTANGTAGGEDFTETETFSTDGKVTTDSRGALVKCHWEGTTLVIETTDTRGQALDESRLALSADGKTTTREYERKTAGDTQKRHEIFEKQ
jgi:hypothetical protein